MLSRLQSQAARQSDGLTGHQRHGVANAQMDNLEASLMAEAHQMHDMIMAVPEKGHQHNRSEQPAEHETGHRQCTA